MPAKTDPRDPLRWLWRGAVLAVLVIGWIFIAWKNHFHVSAPMVFVCLGYLAVVVTIYNLWRTGAAAVDSAEAGADSTWAKPAGALGELEREKRTLLKAIKEAEFDHQMGKLSQHDVDEMIRGYRTRAIEVIKEIDRLGLGAAGTVREQILREVRARVQLEGKSPKKAAADKAGAGGKRAANATGKVKDAPALAPSAAAPEVAHAAAGAAAEHAAATTEATAGASTAATTEATTGASTEATTEAASAAAASARPASTAHVPSDEDLDADSTTTVEPRRDDPAKEATP